jgi:hypothetical protein
MMACANAPTAHPPNIATTSKSHTGCGLATLASITDTIIKTTNHVTPLLGSIFADQTERCGCCCCFWTKTWFARSWRVYELCVLPHMKTVNSVESALRSLSMKQLRDLFTL